MNRDLSIDLIKVIAMFGVIMLHTFGLYQTTLASRAFYETAVVSIPLFFCVSGYLILGKGSLTFKYGIQKSLKIIKFIFVISVIYVLGHFLLKGGDIFSFFCTTFLGAFYMKGPFWMCWYLGVSAILYLISPLLHKYINRFQSIYFIILLALLLCQFCVFSLNIIDTDGGGNFESRIVQPLRVYNWLFYYMLGGLLKKLNSVIGKKELHYKKKKEFVVSLVIVLLLNIVFQEYFRVYIHSDLCEYFYCSLITVVFVILLFLYILNIKQSGFLKNGAIMNLFSSIFLPVYILHYFVVIIVQQLLHSIVVPWLQPFLLFFVVSIIVVPLSIAIMKIPYINKIFQI